MSHVFVLYIYLRRILFKHEHIESDEIMQQLNFEYSKSNLVYQQIISIIFE